MLTKELRGDDGQVRELFGIEVNWLPGAKGWEMKEIPGTEFVMPAGLVLIAMGFLHVVRDRHCGRVGREDRPAATSSSITGCRACPGYLPRRHGSRGLAGGSRNQPGSHHGSRGGQRCTGNAGI